MANMPKISSSFRRMLSLLLASSFSVSVAAAAPDEVQAAQMAQSLHKNLARSFVLDKGLPLEPSLRTAAEEMSAAHLARIDKLLPAWLKEERSLQTAHGKALEPHTLYYAVWARLLNELALWQIEPGDADYERATLAALRTSPRVCLVSGDSRFNDFASRILRIQAMPEAQRSAALATERQLLAHWGEARAAIAPWPDPLPQDAAQSLIKRELVEGPRHARALPPVLASGLLSRQKDYTALHPTVQCALQQWWLQESLRQGAAPAAVLNAFRYGTLISATDRFIEAATAPPADDKAKPASAKPDYPKLAGRFLVTGVTTMHVQLAADGKPMQASVANRKIDVPGIRGVRPVAFENIFDKPSVKYALAGSHYGKPSGSAPFSFQLVWGFDDSAETPATTQSGARQ
jgi:hypothetical protein